MVTAFGDEYAIFGAGINYYLVDGLAIGGAFETWRGGSPTVSKLTLSTQYVFHQVPRIKPYVGAFYRRTFVTGLDDLDSFGGRVGPAARKEIGWTVVDTLDPAFIPAGPWLEFHGDQCYPPPRARLLARNALGVQAFALGRHLAVQFHPEVDEAQLRGWLEAGGRAEAERAGVDPDRFLAETAAEEPAARDRAERLVATALRIAAA